ncbi:MmoB/DmpM family protein [Acinetobacter soli]|uniref:MmoB/DmpM family protein n=1 Tax=Acinetobacter soli TaxID=487316 RepID=UPI0012501795|nr:MmoB/DmpM family protein [Acinetobacter soli]
MSQDKHEQDFVGPILGVGEVAEAAEEAVYIDNPDREIRIVKNSGYVRIEARGMCKITVETMADILGREFRLGELERSMPGFAGFVRTGDDEIIFMSSSK